MYTFFLSVIPGHSAANFRIGKFPRYRTLIARIHAGAALNTVLHLEMNFSILIFCVAVSRTHIRRALMRARGIANIGINPNVRLDI